MTPRILMMQTLKRSQVTKLSLLHLSRSLQLQTSSKHQKPLLLSAMTQANLQRQARRNFANEAAKKETPSSLKRNVSPYLNHTNLKILDELFLTASRECGPISSTLSQQFMIYVPETRLSIAEKRRKIALDLRMLPTLQHIKSKEEILLKNTEDAAEKQMIKNCIENEIAIRNMKIQIDNIEALYPLVEKFESELAANISKHSIFSKNLSFQEIQQLAAMISHKIPETLWQAKEVESKTQKEQPENQGTNFYHFNWSKLFNHFMLTTRVCLTHFNDILNNTWASTSLENLTGTSILTTEIIDLMRKHLPTLNEKQSLRITG